MRFNQFNENSAMDSTVRIMQKTFSDERRAVQDKVLEVVRMVQMGKGDKIEIARVITELAKSELEVKRSDPDLKISVDQNLGMLDRAMKVVTGMSEGITEEELEEYKSIASLRNRSSLDAMARLQNRNKPKEPKVIEIPKGTQLDLFKKASEDIEEAREIDASKMQAYRDFAKENNVDDDSVRMAVDNPDHVETKRMMTNDDFAKAVAMYKSALKESVAEALTEEQFDEKAGEKDACYRKVKSRYKVWPSAYASGALTKCRKVGAANWGKSKSK